MDNASDYYQILHVSREAPLEVIRASYRALMQAMKKHPDLGGDHHSAALINEAYATLSDSRKRAEYDKTRRFRQGHGEPDAGAQASAAGPNKPRRAPSKTTPYPRSRFDAYSRCPFCDAQHTQSTVDSEEAGCAQCSSPLFPAARYVSSRSGLRMMERFPKQQTITLFTAWPSAGFQGKTLDVSLNGMLIQTHTPLQPQQTVKISCDMCQAIARVAHLSQDADAWKVGVEFITLRFTKSQGSIVSARA